MLRAGLLHYLLLLGWFQQRVTVQKTEQRRKILHDRRSVKEWTPTCTPYVLDRCEVVGPFSAADTPFETNLIDSPRAPVFH